MLYFVSFDLTDEHQDKYEEIYEWAHSTPGGYHYVELKEGGWGRLPSTCVVVSLDAEKALDAAEQFEKDIYELNGAVTTHVCAIKNGAPAGTSEVLEVPSYAKKSDQISKIYVFLKKERSN